MKLIYFRRKAVLSIVEHAIDKINDGVCIGVYGCDLHNKMFNEDYFIVYHSKAVEWLKNNDTDTFFAIETVKEYEEFNFGEMTTEITPEKIVNMLAYIIGELVLNECKTLSEKWDEELTEEDLQAIKEELEEI